MKEVHEVKRGGKHFAHIAVSGAMFCDIIDCKVLFDRTVFKAGLPDIAVFDFVSENAEFITDFDDAGLKCLISVKKGKNLLAGYEQLFKVGFLVSGDAIVGHEYEWTFSQESFSLALPVKPGQPGKAIPSNWEGAKIKVRELMQKFTIRIVE